MATNKFLRNDGWFQQVDSASVVLSTAATGTGFLGSLTNSLTAPVSLSSTALFVGPTVSQGSSGTWLAMAGVTIGNATGGNMTAFAQLYDTSTTIDSGSLSLSNGFSGVIALSGVIASPAGNIQVRVASNVAPNGTIGSSGSGFTKDSTLTVIRIG